MREDMDRAIEMKMRDAGIPAPTIKAFLNAVHQVQEGATGLLPELAIEPVPERELPHLDDLPEARDADSGPLQQLAVIKLSGGLGTGMGLDRAKSLLPVKAGATFLDFVAQQILHLRERWFQRRSAPWPAFYLMNSLGTRPDTLAHLQRYPELNDADGQLDFLQNMVPRIDARTFQPVAWPVQRALEWCPPGHGDLYPALQGCGLLDRLLARGAKFLFVSNVDNLGATVDLQLLRYFAASGLSFLMEVTARTAADHKGGHLARRCSDRRYVLRESAQVPPGDEGDFQNITRHCFFNTNNLWIRLEDLRDALDRHAGTIPLPVIQNVKTIDPRHAGSPEVLQLESAMGAAIECFEKSHAVVVPRSRFAPVKTTSDLLVMRSDAYCVTDEFRLLLAECRRGRPPLVTLDRRYYKLLSDFEERFRDGIPSLRECESLKVTGKVTFARGVVCRGQVEFVTAAEEAKTVPPGTYGDERREL